MAKKFDVPSNQINNCEGEIGIILGIEHFNISPMSHIVKQKRQKQNNKNTKQKQKNQNQKAKTKEQIKTKTQTKNEKSK